MSEGTHGGRRLGTTPAVPSDGDAAQPATTGATVVRFTPGAADDGVRQLGEAGMQVTSSRELTSALSDAAAVPSDFGGASVLYFERFGIAIVQDEPGRVRSALARAATDKAIANARPERVYRALGSLPGSGSGAIAEELAPVFGLVGS